MQTEAQYIEKIAALEQVNRELLESKNYCERSTGQAPWYHSQPKG